MLAVDIETTGLDPLTCSILSIGLVLFNEEQIIDTKYILVRPSCAPSVRGEIVALEMHKELLFEAYEKGTPEDLVMGAIEEFAQKPGVMCGKNYGAFDLQFLKRLPNPTRFNWPHRSIDPVAYFLRSDDVKAPSLHECLERAGMSRVVTHNALQDALCVARLVQAGLKKFSILKVDQAAPLG